MKKYFFLSDFNNNNRYVIERSEPETPHYTESIEITNQLIDNDAVRESGDELEMYY